MLYANSVRVSGFNNVYKYTRKASLPDHIRPERSEELLKEYPDLTPGDVRQKHPHPLTPHGQVLLYGQYLCMRQETCRTGFRTAHLAINIFTFADADEFFVH